MPNVKKYLMTSIILGSIAMASGLLIGATNLVTSGPIAEYEQTQINNGIKEVFKGYDNIHYAKDEDVEQTDENKYVTHVYYVYDGVNENDENNTFVGWAFKTEGSNSYGKVALIVGFNNEAIYKNLSVVKNEQSFASTLKKKYLTKVQNKECEIADVSCGATFGAKLVRDMVNNAQEVANKMK